MYQMMCNFVGLVFIVRKLPYEDIRNPAVPDFLLLQRHLSRILSPAHCVVERVDPRSEFREQPLAHGIFQFTEDLGGPYLQEQIYQPIDGKGFSEQGGNGQQIQILVRTVGRVAASAHGRRSRVSGFVFGSGCGKHSREILGAVFPRWQIRKRGAQGHSVGL